MISLVQALKKQKSSATDPSSPGIVLTNAGELWWWPEGKRGLSPLTRHGIPMSSAVHYGRRYDPKQNSIPENRCPAEHVQYIFEKALPAMVSSTAKIDVIAVGDVAEDVERYLDNDDIWAKVGGQLSSLAILGGFYNMADSKCEGFKKFMKEVWCSCAHILPSGQFANPAALTASSSIPAGQQPAWYAPFWTRWWFGGWLCVRLSDV